MLRFRTGLNYGWRFTPDYSPSKTKNENLDFTVRPVDIPHNSGSGKFNYFSGEDDSKIVQYSKLFVVPEEMEGKNIILHFDGVMSCAAVFVNDKAAFAHKGGFTSAPTLHRMVRLLISSATAEFTAMCGSKQCPNCTSRTPLSILCLPTRAGNWTLQARSAVTAATENSRFRCMTALSVLAHASTRRSRPIIMCHGRFLRISRRGLPKLPSSIPSR